MKKLHFSAICFELLMAITAFVCAIVGFANKAFFMGLLSLIETAIFLVLANWSYARWCESDLVATKRPYNPEVDPLISVENLRQHFGPIKAVDDVSFHIMKGEVFGLVGESGCGKSTTGRAIIKLYNATGGDVYFKGHRICAGPYDYVEAIKEAKKNAAAEITAIKADTEANPNNKDDNDKKIAAIKAELKKVVQFIERRSYPQDTIRRTSTENTPRRSWQR